MKKEQSRREHRTPRRGLSSQSSIGNLALTQVAIYSARWVGRAVCAQEDPELFFPHGDRGPAAQQIEDAKSVCQTCPVINECLAYALQTDQDFGVWGGHSESERRAIKRRQIRAKN